MAQRVQIPELQGGSINPQAAPVNRFSTPEQPLRTIGPSTGQQIAEALSSLAPGLVRFSANRDQRKSEEEILKAREKRAKNALTFKDAVANGVITADQNPWFVKSWKEMDGAVAADRYNEDLLLAMSTGPLANATDHDASSKLLDNFRTNWVNSNLQDMDTDYVAGFRAKAAGYDFNIRNAQASRVGNNIVAAAGEAFDNTIQGILGESVSRGISSSAVADGINLAADKAILTGMAPKDVNTLILKAVENDAMQNLDVTHADAVLQEIKGGPGSSLGNTTAAKAMLESVSNRIANELHQRDSWSHEEEVRHKQQVVADANTTVGTALLDMSIKRQPATLEQFKDQINAVYKTGGWEQAQNLQKAILASQKESFTEATFVKESLYTDVYSKHLIDFDRLNRELSAGTISIATYKDLGDKMNEIAKQDKADSKEPSFYKNQSYKSKGDFLDKVLAGDEKIFNFESLVQRNQANTQFWDSMYAWDKANPKATPDEQLAKATEVSQRLIEDFRNADFAGLTDTVPNIIGQAPGVKSGNVKPIGVGDHTTWEPAFANVKEFEAALADYATKGASSIMATKAKAAGIPIKDFITQQNILFPEGTAATPAKKK